MIYDLKRCKIHFPISILFVYLLVVLFSFTTHPLFSKPVELTILYDNDVHGHLLPFDDIRQGKDIGGAARRSFLIHQYKKNNPNTIALTAGDWISGTPISGFFKGKADWEAFEKMGYDAYAIGNHEFDYGQIPLRNFIQTTKIPVVSANILDSKSLKPFTKPYIIIKKNNLKIAVIGVITPETPIVTHPKNVIGLKFEDPVKTVNKYVNELRSKVNIIIILSHLGYSEDKELARSIKGIDIIVGGHSHTKVEGITKEGSTLIVQAFQWGTFLGELKLSFDHNEITSSEAKLLPINSSIPEDLSIIKLLNDYNIQIKEIMSKPLAESKVDLNKPGYNNPNSNLGTWLCNIFKERLNADISMQNTGGIRSSIPKGTITFSDIYNVLPFENVLVLLEVNGTELKEILDDLAQKAIQGRESCAFTGVKINIKNMEQPEYLIHGVPIDLQKTYTIAVNDFMANGGSGYSLLKKAKLVKYDVNLRDIVADYLKTHPVISPEAENNLIK